MAEMRRVLEDALRLPPQERAQVAGRLLESLDEERNEEDEDRVQAAWAEVIARRSRELRDGTVKGLDLAEARRVITSDPPDDLTRRRWR